MLFVEKYQKMMLLFSILKVYDRLFEYSPFNLSLKCVAIDFAIPFQFFILHT
jgi:hypothetical protein